MNIFKELVVSMYQFDSYKSFLKNKKLKAFFYGVLILTIYFVLSIAIPFAKFQMATGGIGNIIDNYLPDFAMEHGEMWIEEPFLFEEGDMYVEIDTTEGVYFDDVSNMKSFLNQYRQVILIDSEKLIIKDGADIQSMYFSDVSGESFTKADIMEIMPMVNVIIGGIIVFLFFWFLALFFFGVLWLALIGLIIASAVKVRLSFGQIYKLAIYARTLPLLIKGILKLIGIGIPFFWVLNFGISAIYLCFALQKIKDMQSDEADAQGMSYSLNGQQYQNNNYDDNQYR